MTEALKTLDLGNGIWIEIPDVHWNARDRAAWHWAERVDVCEWTEQYRILKRAAVPGPWRFENAPYLRGIMRLAVAVGVERLVIKKAAQIGVSEAMRNLMLYWAAQDACEMGLALPNKDKGTEIIENDVIPAFRDTFNRWDSLRPLLSSRMHDLKKGQLKMANGDFLLHLMWSGSPSSMASNPMRRCISDEVDKFAPWAGNDADPISLIEKRMRTYPDAIHILLSTPTTQLGVISQNFDACNHKLYFLVPCPHCGVRQRLVFGDHHCAYGVKWSDEVRALYKGGDRKAAAAMVRDQGAWYECCHCHAKIDEIHKRNMVRQGIWGTVEEVNGEPGILAGGAIVDAEKVDRWAHGTWLGLQIGSEYCCWHSWTLSHMAAEFLRCSTREMHFAFQTSTCGQTWKESAVRVDKAALNVRRDEATAEEGKLPRWTARLLATVDTQKDHFWVVIRAWGPGMRSQRVWHGRLTTFEAVEKQCMHTAYACEDPRLPAWTCDQIFIDSGGTRNIEEDTEGGSELLPSRVMEVYGWALRHTAMVTVIKGDAHPTKGVFTRPGRGVYVVDKIKKPVPIWLLDVHHFHDELDDLMRRRAPRPARIDMATGEELQAAGEDPVWSLNRNKDPEYLEHIGNMHRVAERAGGIRGALEFKWRPLRDGLRVDYRACECYQVAAAYMRGVNLIADMPTFMAGVEAEITRRDQERKYSTSSQERRGMLQLPDGPFVSRRE